MSNNKGLANRMKEYEFVSRYRLTRRTPAIIRIDGKAFHTFTKGMRKPFDYILMSAMQSTMKYLCENIQGCVFGYTQSDEISLVLTDYEKITTDAWFGYNIQKMSSISASMTSVAFNKFFYKAIDDYANTVEVLSSLSSEDGEEKKETKCYLSTLRDALSKGAVFDARAFSMPKDEVCNYLIWRQQDATRNSIESVGQAYFSHSDLHKKSCDMIQEMLWSQKNINWNDFPTSCKRGACCYRKTSTECLKTENDEFVEVSRNRWIIDTNIPIFTQSRAFIEKWV